MKEWRRDLSMYLIRSSSLETSESALLSILRYFFSLLQPRRVCSHPWAGIFVVFWKSHFMFASKLLSPVMKLAASLRSQSADCYFSMFKGISFWPFCFSAIRLLFVYLKTVESSMDLSLKLVKGIIVSNPIIRSASKRPPQSPNHSSILYVYRSITNWSIDRVISTDVILYWLSGWSRVGQSANLLGTGSLKTKFWNSSSS